MAQNLDHNCPKLPWMVDFYATHKGRIPITQLKAATRLKHIDYASELNIVSQACPWRLTEIVSTIGPSSNTEDGLIALMDAGMSIARLKMSFYTIDEFRETIKVVRSATDKFSKIIGRIYPLAIAVDTTGPEIRTGILLHPEEMVVELVKGQLTTLTTDPYYEDHVTEKMIYVDYEKISNIVGPADYIYLDDGKIVLSVQESINGQVKCFIERTGLLTSAAKVVLPGIPLDLPHLSIKDIENLKVAVEQQIDFIMLSNVSNAAAVTMAREVIGEAGKHIGIISKIQNVHALHNIDGIIEASDGIMIAQDALSVSVLYEKMFLAKKSVMAKCNKLGVPVMCSTQMLFDTEAIVPTKSETSELANDILDGMDGVVTTKQTASGKHPVDVIKAINTICKEAEAAIHLRRVFQDLSDVEIPSEPIYALSIAAVEASIKTHAAAIVICSVTGRSAKTLAKYRPRCPIIAITRRCHIARNLELYRGMYPIIHIKPAKSNWAEDVEDRIQLGITFGKVSGFIKAGDAIVVLTGLRQGTGFTNSIKIIYASEVDTVQR